MKLGTVQNLLKHVSQRVISTSPQIMSKTSDSIKGSLPYGWIVTTSKRYPDRVYYFNVDSGASTWECPELEFPNSGKDNKDSESELKSPLKTISKNDSSKANPENNSISKKPSINNNKHFRSTSKKLESFEENKRTVARKRSFKSEDSSSTKQPKSAIPPTAIVTPVVLGRTPLSTSLPPKHDKVQFSFKNVSKKQKIQKTLPKFTSSIPSTSTRIAQPVASHEYRLSENSMRPESSSGLRNNVVNENNKSTTEPQDQPIASGISDSESSYTDLDMPSDIEGPSPVRFVEEPPSPIHRDPTENTVENIEMLDVSEGLTKIDDLAVSTKSPDDSSSHYIVIDTNILVEDLRYMDEIRDTPLEGCGPPHIIIPWIVIQELDALKQSSKASHSGRAAQQAGRAAQQAVKYLNSMLKPKHPRFHGQSPQKAEDIAKSYSKCNDDGVLECCLDLVEKMPREKVILLTNDKNLVNKALICDIIVHNCKSLLELMKPDVRIEGKNNRKKSRKNKDRSSHLKETKTSHVVGLSKEWHKELDACKSEIHAIMSEGRQLLKEVLEVVFEDEMNDAYGDSWHAFKIEKDVLKGLLDAFARFWRTVFLFCFTEKDKRNFDLLREKASRPEGFLGNQEECISILTAIEDICCGIKRKWPSLDVPVENIQNLRVSCCETFDKHKNIEESISQYESTIKETGNKSVLEAFENNWTVINHLCGMIMDFYQLPHNFVYDKPDSVPSETEFRHLMVNLYPSVEQLKKLMQRVVETIENKNPKNRIFKELFNALENLVPTLEIQTEIPHLQHFTPKSLERFCRNPEYLERVKYGCKQIEHFSSCLENVVHIMSSIKRESHPQNMVTD